MQGPHLPRLVPGRLAATAPRFLGLAALALAATSVSCVGRDSGIDYPDLGGIDLDKVVSQPEGDEDPSISLTEFKFDPRACEGIDLHPIQQKLTYHDLTRWFAARGVNVTPKKARENLWWYEFSDDDGSIRLRLAVLDDPEGAAKDLHDSLLSHGPGWWGVRRSNLAVLAPKAGLKEAVRFAAKYKLQCWGLFTYAGVDDAYVVGGAYTEF